MLSCTRVGPAVAGTGRWEVTSRRQLKEALTSWMTVGLALLCSEPLVPVGNSVGAAFKGLRRARCGAEAEGLRALTWSYKCGEGG